ncbi:MAG: hypothetical protein AVDCRST_MAG36-38, partial [uncultured Nocardioidaceae bacterium]
DHCRHPPARRLRRPHAPRGALRPPRRGAAQRAVGPPERRARLVRPLRRRPPGRPGDRRVRRALLGVRRRRHRADAPGHRPGGCEGAQARRHHQGEPLRGPQHLRGPLQRRRRGPHEAAPGAPRRGRGLPAGPGAQRGPRPSSRPDRRHHRLRLRTPVLRRHRL